MSRRRPTQSDPDDRPILSLADLPDELLRNPPFNPSKARPSYQAHRAALAEWLAAHDLHPSGAELMAERRRRWPVVDRIEHVGESKRDRGHAT